ncbi:NUDIX domain-containing protein [Actinomyces sp. B33]|uniref:NUDIX hydrolase n=1 Tax=Actinomyces sp. B33 TaxID=2942131 RepID=UPI0023411D6C|nr:NUDIX domain-containing protein [Actinomyces sp. B33]MDC4232308.1 NUDIX domain-containing protein [Actinomyces sp. B33]
MSRPPRPAPIPTRLVRAAGAVVWRFADPGRTPVAGEPIDERDLEVLMVHRPRYKDWSWPKGKAEASEPIVSAAVREVEEETGLAVVLGAPLTTQRYRLGSGQTKEVRYWVGSVAPSGADGPVLATRPPVGRAPASEIDEARWAGVRTADGMLTRRGDRRLLAEVVGRAREGGLVTSTLILARHAKAEPRARWDGSEKDRPLTRIGSRQAVDLMGLLSAFGVQSAVSSPWERCARTLAPWAGLGGAPVSWAPELSEEAVAADPDAARRFVAGLVDRPHAPVVVCVHRPTIPVLLDPIARAAPASVRAALPQAGPWLPTAGLLVAHVSHGPDGPGVIAAERHVTRTKDAFAF